MNKYFDCINLSYDQAPIVIAFDDEDFPFNYPKRNFSLYIYVNNSYDKYKFFLNNFKKIFTFVYVKS